MEGVAIRQADFDDVDAIAEAHRDSIQSLGALFYRPADLAAWQSGVSGELYRDAMRGGEVFFVATGTLGREPLVLGFSSDYPIEGPLHGTSVYVRGSAARKGIGRALLRHAEAFALTRGATSIQIEASLAGVAFYEANGYQQVSQGHARLTSGHLIACVRMRKHLAGQ